MSPEQYPASQFSPNRRLVLKSLSTAGATFTLGASTIGTAGAASCELPTDEEYSSEEEYKWKRDDSDDYVHDAGDTYDRATEIQSGLVYKEPVYVDNESRWFHFFRSAGAVYTLRKQSWESDSEFSLIGMTDYQMLEIENHDTANTALYTTDNAKDVGAAPSPSSGNDLNWGRAAWTAGISALSTKTKYAIPIGIGQFLAALLDNSESESGQTVTYLWDYDWNEGPCESIHYGRYEFQSFDGYSHADFHVRNIGTYDGAGGIETKYNVYVDAVPDEMSTTGTSDSETTNVPSPGTTEYTKFLEQSGAATKIPFNRIKDRRIKELADGGPVYQATNPQSEITVNSRPIKPQEAEELK